MNKSLQYSLELFNSINSNNLCYIYRGCFTQKISDNIISIAEQTLDASQTSPYVRKRLFAVLVECLQNILRHQLTVESQEFQSDSPHSGMLVAQKKDDFYQITSSNVIEATLVPTLRNLLEKINSLNQKELKQFYLEVLNNSTVSDKGGAGLGLIDIARKSNSELFYEFQPLNEQFSTFYLHTTIPHSTTPPPHIEFNLGAIPTIHRIVNEHDIMLVYSGKLNQDNLISLLSIINDLHYGEYDIKKKVFNIMVEMLQNIVKHGAKIQESDNGNPAIFFVVETDNALVLNSGNYVPNSVIDKLTNNVNHVNSLTDEELNAYYVTQLLNFDIDTHKESGLGIIDLRIKSNNPINYHSVPISNELSFFTIQVTVNFKN
ncbi:MAG: SiaB family protein kinase [Bacteroidales bacterium]|jgi:hypothetical protein|nr:SiaB family protein kinase [Bacteroidales bacterium]